MGDTGTVYFTASSLDGYIVDEADSLDWLMSRAVDANGPFGYEAFVKGVGALVMGSSTYEWLVKNQPGDWMYEQPSWVLTHRPHIIDEELAVATMMTATGSFDHRAIDGADAAQLMQAFREFAENPLALV